ncbi:MAG: hypothetical protein A3I44_03185 [Candidatus Sungbacteria bacterium RIFCSPLOWO2_02_FULL_51_17]|uniref:Uncharacterized protein n=1 Tax=Candidatus Sungbacteria bacterium RIFCSPHIGHO2_02_FULL_51_29 TaxID=1802273 RepID=A0A1G2KTB7_9BACT|nr:MAG: hypothetical protein A2676_02125 [Candidatus Sungbacteria bacterium RIFCSPHIGHO2_01_FULL_51_22]OHA01701.1 MAG: hypothetical protein A3C16_03130 [Candidatus Sungbacteria bacterium RIFCSPHIGHO2_02_FULL_51_29]OHA10988.1 MAG: hypothetical protein A3I44_03185 [Candidatus Sungbacteria bacterium RIFCSPLOWO2_02_FULL_51_17]
MYGRMGNEERGADSSPKSLVIANPRDAILAEVAEGQREERRRLVLERAILRYSSMNAWAQRYFGLRRALTVEEVKALSREAATSHLKMLVKGLTILPTAIALWFSPAALLTFFAISHGLGLLAVFALVFWAISCFVPLTAGIDDDAFSFVRNFFRKYFMWGIVRSASFLLRGYYSDAWKFSHGSLSDTDKKELSEFYFGRQ